MQRILTAIWDPNRERRRLKRQLRLGRQEIKDRRKAGELDGLDVLAGAVAELEDELALRD